MLFSDGDRVPRTVLPNCGLETSRLGFGLSHLHHIPFNRDRERLLDAAHELGFTHFDTARAYGDGLGERALGQLVRSHRASLTIATKFGLHSWDWLGATGSLSYPVRAARGALARGRLIQWPKHDYSVRAMQRSLDISLSLLRTDYVDILFLHEPPTVEFSIDEALREALLQVRTAGKVRYLGIAGGAAPQVFQRHRELFDVFQCPESVLDAAACVIPDLTYGVMRTVQHVTRVESETRAVAALRRAFARREAGGIIIGTTRLAHLKEYVSAAWLLEPGR